MLPARCKGYKQLAMYITIKVFNVRIVLPSLRFVAALKLFKATCVNKHSQTRYQPFIRRGPSMNFFLCAFVFLASTIFIDSTTDAQCEVNTAAQ